MEDLKYWVALTRMSGLGPKRFEHLARTFDHLGEVWSADLDTLMEADVDRTTAVSIVTERARIDPDKELAKLHDQGVDPIPIFSDRYPEALKEIYDPPPVLYIRGELTKADRTNVAVVGTRKPTTYGRESARMLAAELGSRGVAVTSGLARGIDGIAHAAALEAGGRSVAVLGSGLDTIYPAEHLNMAKEIARSGALITEHPLGTRPDARNFPRRNRILSGLSMGVLVVEAAFKSGAMLTVEHAVQQNREVFAVPGNILSPNSAGTNWLIQQGAKLVTQVQDVLDELRIASPPAQMPMESVEPESEVERQVFAQIASEPMHIDDVTRATGLSSSLVASTLAMMELKGMVRQSGPMQYVRAHPKRFERGLGSG